MPARGEAFGLGKEVRLLEAVDFPELSRKFFWIFFVIFDFIGDLNDLPFDDGIEVGWRLSKAHWGEGYATEAGLVSLKFAFNTLELQEVVSITSLINRPSQKVMEKLGMVNSDRNFMHPRLAEESELREHVLYSMSRVQFENR